MARRVALARAIALDPELMMYDEPFAGLDPISLGITANLIRTLNRALGATSILVTHDVPESFAICRLRLFQSRNGGVAAEGTPEELRASTDPTVRQFIDGVPDGPFKFHYPSAAARGGLRHWRGSVERRHDRSSPAVGRRSSRACASSATPRASSSRLVVEFFPLAAPAASCHEADPLRR